MSSPFLANNEYNFIYHPEDDTRVRSWHTYAPNIDIAYDFFHEKMGHRVKVLEVVETAIRFRDDDGLSINE